MTRCALLVLTLARGVLAQGLPAPGNFPDGLTIGGSGGGCVFVTGAGPVASTTCALSSGPLNTVNNIPALNNFETASGQNTATSGTQGSASFVLEANPPGASSALYYGTTNVCGTLGANSQNITGVIEGSIGQGNHYGSGNLAVLAGVEGDATVQVGAGNVTGQAYGVVGFYSNQGAATVADGRGVNGQCTQVGAGATTVCRGVAGRVIGAGGTITKAYAVDARDNVATGITGKAGLVTDEMTGATNNTDLLIGAGTDPVPPAGSWAINSLSTRASTLAGSLSLPSIKAASGTRYLCIDANGLISSSAAACSGT